MLNGRCQGLTIEPPEEVKRLKEVVFKLLCAVHGSNVCAIDIDEMKKEQDQTQIHGRYQIKSRLGRTRSVSFSMVLDKQNQLISYARGRMI
jgi:hypothetical protein